MPQALTESDANVPKMALFALLEGYSTFDRADLYTMNEILPTPSGPVQPVEDMMSAIERIRTDGKAVPGTERTRVDGAPGWRFRYVFSETDFPGGARTIWLALMLRMTRLLGIPIPDKCCPRTPRKASTGRPSNNWPRPSRSSNPPKTVH